MKTTPSRRNPDAFTVLELLCVIGIIVVLAALVLPALSQAKARAKRIQCLEQLHQTGLAFVSFAHEHDGKFPMSVQTNAGGSWEYVSGYDANQSFDVSFRHFQTLADELRTPRVLNCPSDSRAPAPSFGTFQNENLSYFVALNAEFSQPNSVLAGDRNLTNDYTGASTVVRVGPNATLRWTRELHEFKGNLLFADGRVEENNNPRLAFATGQGLTANLALPTGPPAIGPGGPTHTGGPNTPGVQGNPTPANNPSRPKVQPVVNSAVTPSSPIPENSTPPPGQPWMPKATLVSQQRLADGSSAPTAMPSQTLTPPAKPVVDPTNASAWLLRKEQAPDPGFSLFPESMAVIPKALIRKSAWPLWILLALLIGGLLARFKFLRNSRD